VAGQKLGRAMDPRARMVAGGGGLVRSGSEMSLQPGDPRMHKRLKGQLSGKPSGVDASGRCGVVVVVVGCSAGPCAAACAWRVHGPCPSHDTGVAAPRAPA
jgi:hypothetical protein